jgi:hypothetical protein
LTRRWVCLLWIGFVIVKCTYRTYWMLFKILPCVLYTSPLVSTCFAKQIIKVKLKVTLRSTVSRPVSLGVKHPPRKAHLLSFLSIWYDTDRIENDLFSISIVACVFVAVGTCLPSRYLATKGTHTQTHTRKARWLHKPPPIFSPLPNFEKVKWALWDHLAVFESVTRESQSNAARRDLSVCLYVYPTIVARQRLGKNRRTVRLVAFYAVRVVSKESLSVCVLLCHFKAAAQ